jgi:uncharacterized protein (TIGR02147 family)
MKARAEQLWQDLTQATSEDAKKTLRAQYRIAVDTYKRQSLIVEESPSKEVGSARGSHRVKVRAAPLGTRPDPFQYQDYREFLLTWIRYLKKEKGESVKSFSEKVGLSLEYLVRVLKRWQPMSSESFQKILNGLGLSATENSFLEALHCIADTESHAMRLASVKRLQTFSEYRKAHPREHETWRYLSHWYNVAIREMSTLPGFKLDPEWIQKKLRQKVPRGNIEVALKFLESAGFFQIENGRVKTLLKQVNCAGGIYRLALGQFHREMLGIAADSIQNVSSDKRFLAGHTVAISPKQYDEVRRILQEALERINQLDSGENSQDDVYHVELLAVPLTRGSES